MPTTAESTCRFSDAAPVGFVGHWRELGRYGVALNHRRNGRRRQEQFFRRTRRLSWRALACSSGFAYRADPLSRPAEDTALGVGYDGNLDDKHFDLVILGSGSTAFAAALAAQELGKTAIITESRAIGGTCVNRGCLRLKNLIERRS